MKKLLYGSTALVAAGMLAGGAQAADKISVGVGGYFQTLFSIADQDDGVGEAAANTRDHGLDREGEIIFNGKTTLDNGIEVGVQVQLEAETCGDQIDESFVWIEAGWGRINIGAENSAPYLMHYSAPAPFVGVNSPNFRVPSPGGNAASITLTPNQLTSDSEKLTYFTPRIQGFQLGISYTPDNCEDATGGIGNCGGTYAGLEADNTAGQQSEVLEIGANFVRKFGDVGVNVSAGYGKADLEVAAAGSEDRDEWNVGASFTYMGFTLGGSYRDDDQGTSGGNTDRMDWTVGLGYGTGPWSVGVQYAHTEVEAGAGASEDELDAFEVGGEYTLGPGISVGAALQYWDWDDNAGARANENDATVFSVGTKFSF